jgi:hypothetical protein
MTRWYDCQHSPNERDLRCTPFTEPGGPPAIRKMCEQSPKVPHGQKIRGYGGAYPKNPEIGNTYALKM